MFFLKNDLINNKITFLGSEGTNRLVFTKPTWDIGIEIPEAGKNFGINILGTGPNITVDWGDGTVNNYTTTGTKLKSYASAGNYTVKISGSFISNGNIRLGSGRFGQSDNTRPFIRSTSVIPRIPGLTSFQNTFFLCVNLTAIPPGLFDNNVDVTSFANCFESCSSLFTIPPKLFNNNVNVTSFADCFENCVNLTTIPPNLFDNNVIVTNFANCFLYCQGLTTIPSGLFVNNVNVDSFSFCFADCLNLTTVPSNLFDNNVNVTSFANCFEGITLSTESYSNLLINMASNAAARLNSVLFGGGNSKYNSSGATARATFEAKFWTFYDAGPA
jgi:hypothetical protein